MSLLFLCRMRAGGILKSQPNKSFLEGQKEYAELGEHSIAAHYVRPYTTSETPPSGLGYTPAVDRYAASTTGDYGPSLGWNLPYLGGVKWRPLWNEVEVVKGKRQLEYDLRLRTPHSWQEEVQLFTPANTRAPPASSNTSPLFWWGQR